MIEQQQRGHISPRHLSILADVASRPVPQLALAPILQNRTVNHDCRLLTIHCPEIAANAEPGQFVMLTLAREGETLPVLPRPMAIYEWSSTAGTVEIAYRIVGAGTRLLAGWSTGERIAIVGPLGRGFVLLPTTERILLLGRGIGSCSLTALAGRAHERGVAVAAVDSAQHPDWLFGIDYYHRVGVDRVLAVADSDGSSDLTRLRGAVSSLLGDETVDQIFVCGSARLAGLALELADAYGAQAQVSIEAHMACGLGYCHACATGGPSGAESPLVCVDGPVFVLATRRDDIVAGAH